MTEKVAEIKAMSQMDVTQSMATNQSNQVKSLSIQTNNANSNKDDKEQADFCLPRIKSPDNPPIVSGGYNASQFGMMADFTPRKMTARRGSMLEEIRVDINETSNTD